jgi:uncharacterized protein
MSNIQLAQEMYDAFNRGDVGTVLGIMEPNIEWHEAEGNPYDPSGSGWIGPDAIMQNLFMRIGTDFDGFTVHPKEFHDAGDTLVVELRYTAKHKGTGKDLDAHVCHVLRLKDGKLTSFQQFMNTAHLQDVMGAR